MESEGVVSPASPHPGERRRSAEVVVFSGAPNPALVAEESRKLHCLARQGYSSQRLKSSVYQHDSEGRIRWSSTRVRFPVACAAGGVYSADVTCEVEPLPAERGRVARIVRGSLRRACNISKVRQRLGCVLDTPPGRQAVRDSCGKGGDYSSYPFFRSIGARNDRCSSLLNEALTDLSMALRSPSPVALGEKAENSMIAVAREEISVGTNAASGFENQDTCVPESAVGSDLLDSLEAIPAVMKGMCSAPAPATRADLCVDAENAELFEHTSASLAALEAAALGSSPKWNVCENAGEARVCARCDNHATDSVGSAVPSAVGARDNRFARLKGADYACTSDIVSFHPGYCRAREKGDEVRDVGGKSSEYELEPGFLSDVNFGPGDHRSLRSLGDVVAGEVASFLCLIRQVGAVRRVRSRAGQCYVLSEVCCGDEAKPFLNLTLWKNAASWGAWIEIGDIVQFTGIKFKEFRGDVCGNSLGISHFRVAWRRRRTVVVESDVASVPQLYSREQLTVFRRWASRQGVWLPVRTVEDRSLARTVQYIRVVDMRDGILAHVIGTVKDVAFACGGAGFAVRYSDRIQLRICDSSCKGIWLCLWDYAEDELSSFVPNAVYDFRFLSGAFSTDIGALCLHSTARTQIRRLLPSDARFGAAPADKCNDLKVFDSIAELFSSQFSGRAVLRCVQLTSVRPRERIHETLLRDSLDAAASFVFLSCVGCNSEVLGDENGVYRCNFCPWRPETARPALTWTFRPLEVELTDGTSRLAVSLEDSMLIRKMFHCSESSLLSSRDSRLLFVQGMRNLDSSCRRTVELLCHVEVGEDGIHNFRAYWLRGFVT